MKKAKLSLDALEVRSFVTSVDRKQLNTIKGGDPSDICESLTTGAGDPEREHEKWTGVYVCASANTCENAGC